MKRREIQAVHDPDLRPLLDKLGILSLLDNGEIVCGICGCELKPEDVGCIYASSGDVRVCCDKATCLTRATERKTHDEHDD